MILVTGATGFLGKNVCANLKECGLPFTSTSLSLGCDLRDRKETIRLFEKVRPQYVIHCAAYVGGIQFGLKNPVAVFEDNLFITLNVFHAAKLVGVERIINPVSNCTYPGKLEYFKEEEFWEGPLHDSVKYYGMSRKATVVAAQAYQKQFGLDVVNLVLPNMYGPQDHFQEERSHALGALVKKFVDAELNNSPTVTVWGTGSPVREWLYVEDAAEAMIRSLKLAPQQEILNIGLGSGISIKDLAFLISDAVSYSGKIVFDETKSDGAPYKTMDGRRAKVLLDWTPTISLPDGVQKTVHWYKHNYI